MSLTPCKKAQEGFYCTRGAGHPGVCQVEPLVPGAFPGGIPAIPEHSGGPVSYYLVRVSNPNQGADPYTAECGDIIEALGMDFNEGCAFKAIWRSAAARTLKKLKHAGDPLYDAQKVAFYGQRMIAVIEGKKGQREGAVQAVKRLAHSLETSRAQAARDPGYDPRTEMSAMIGKLVEAVKDM